MAKINYNNLSSRVCLYCKVEYKPTGPAQKACPLCQGFLNSVESQVKRDILRYKKFGTYERLGQGYSNKKGSEHTQYVNGIGSFISTLSPRAKQELRYCQSCGKDLIDAGRYHWCAHHIDHDRSNNTWENITLLCKSCHQREHKVWENFNMESATTISEESTLK